MTTHVQTVELNLATIYKYSNLTTSLNQFSDMDVT